jgi:hypothetical protein
MVCGAKDASRTGVDRPTWEAVQRKLDKPKRANAPRTAAQYLGGLVYCGNCGERMVTGSIRRNTKNPRKDGYTGVRHEYFCGTYHKAAREKWPWEGVSCRAWACLSGLPRS